MTNLEEGDVFKLTNVLKLEAKTGYDFATVKKVTKTHELGSFMIEAMLHDEPKDVKRIKRIHNSEFIGNTYCFSLHDINC